MMVFYSGGWETMTPHKLFHSLSGFPLHCMHFSPRVYSNSFLLMKSSDDVKKENSILI